MQDRGLDMENENENRIDMKRYSSLFVSGIIFIIVIIIVSMITFNRHETVKLDQDKVSVEIGEDYQIYYSLTGLKTEQLIWKSTNEDVAAVDSKGNVIGISEGKAIVYVSDEENIKAMIEVTVLEKESE